MSIHEIAVRTIDGEETTLDEFSGKALLIVNVASKCGFTPQYTQLQELHETYGGRGLAVLGFPCNQFGGQEPGTSEEIKEFCSLTYDVSFRMFEKIDVNGDARHPLYGELTSRADADGKAGDVMWNFEKFLVAPDGAVVGRFRTQVSPTSEEVVSAIEQQLP
ncbi:MAG TPA: glutathione peroxidase [Actinomycetota bacterium]|jgi:glutathione peroxidase|nr:glutathione peroxidase [Actinomycetota bacterium]